MKFIIGKKLDMTQVWQGDKVVAVTRVQAGPCTVAQVKTDEKDGYSAVQVGYGERKEKNIAKPQLGHIKNLDNFRYLREFRSFAKATEGKSGLGDLKRGDVINVGSFEVGDEIQVTGISKGKGFQGVVKRHGFHGQDKTHGTKDQLRMPGSIGATGPAHVFKGQKMPGRMGGDRVTVKGLEVVEVDKENNVLLIKGAVPGARNGLVLIQGEGDITPITPKDANLRQDEENIKIPEHENTENTKIPKLAKRVRDPDSHVGTLKHENNNKESGIMNKELGGEIENKKNKDENIEKVVVEAHEKVEDKKKSEEKK